MNISNLPTRFCRRFGTHFSTLALATITLLAIAPSSFAQRGDGRPVDRLISSSVVNAVSRPRRVAELSSVTSEATGTAAPLTPSIADATTIERTAFVKTNAARMQNGLPVLTWDPLLCRMARMHSEDMAQRNYFAHETPEGLEPKDRGRALGFQFRVLGENIASNKGFADPGSFAVERWLLSGAHRANILYVEFQSSAVGSFVAADGTVYLTQVFITR
jgi:uncharacterized protein YkwD